MCKTMNCYKSGFFNATIIFISKEFLITNNLKKAVLNWLNFKQHF